MEEESPKSIKCSSCGAPLPYKHGENVLHCNYCGSTTMLADYDNIVTIAEPYIIPVRFKKDRIGQVCRQWMSEGVFKAADLANRSSFTEISPMYLPFWTIYAHVSTQYTADRGGDLVSGSREEDVAWVVYARTDPGEFFGFWALNPGAKSTSPDWGDFPFRVNLGSEESKGIDLVTGREIFDQRLVGDIEVINGQISEEEAREKAGNEIARYTRMKTSEDVGGASSVDSKVDITRAELVYLPLYSVIYMYEGKNYRMLVHGHTGQVLAGEAPVGRWDKVVVLAVICGVVAVLFGVAASFVGIPYLYIGSAVAILVFGVYALKAALEG